MSWLDVAADLLDPPPPRYATPADLAEQLTADSPPGQRWLRPAHLDVLGRAIADTVDSGGRLIVSMPPRHGKSELASLWAPVWYLDRHPDRRVILASYAASLSAGWGRRIRNTATHDHPGKLGFTVADDSAAKNDWATSAGGGLLSVGVGGGITGRGADLLIVDDPVKDAAQAYSPTYRAATWDWWTTTARTRLHPGGAVIVIMTRWHHDDLVGRLLAADRKGTGEDWTVLDLPALAGPADPLGRAEGEPLWPARYDAAALAKLRDSVGPTAWAALYQQTPTTDEGAILPRGAWRHYTAPRWTEHDGICRPHGNGPVWQSWDLAFKGTDGSDFVVGQVWTLDGADRVLLDQVRGRWSFTETCQAIIDLSARWPDAIAKLVEDKANGPAVIDHLASTVGGLIPVEPRGGKQARAHAVAPLVHAGNVLLPDPTLADWVVGLIDEAALFPAGAHDDQVDALTQALAWDPTPDPHEQVIDLYEPLPY